MSRILEWFVYSVHQLQAAAKSNLNATMNMTITNLSAWWAQAVQAVQAGCLRYCSGSLTVLGAKDRCFPTCHDSYLSQSTWPRHMWHRILIASLSEHASKLHKHVTHSCNSARGSVNLRMAAFHFQPTGLLGCQKAAVFTRMWYQSALRSWRGAIFAPFCSTGSVSTSDHLPKASRKFSKPWRLLMLRYAGGVNQQTILSAGKLPAIWKQRWSQTWLSILNTANGW